MKNSKLVSLTYNFDWPRGLMDDPVDMLRGMSAELDEVIGLSEYWEWKRFDDLIASSVTERILVIVALTSENLSWILLKYPQGKHTHNMHNMD